MIEKIKKFFASTDTPRWHGYTVSLVAALFSVVFTIEGNNWKNRDDVKIANERALNDSMISFQIHASSFASSIMDNTDNISKAKNILLDNLNEQYERALQTEQYGGQDLKEWRTYEEAITKLRDIVDKTNDLNSLGPFWTAASKLLVARNRLRERLDKSI